MASILVPVLVLGVICTNIKADEDDPVVEGNLETVRKTILNDPCYKQFMAWPRNWPVARKECKIAVDALVRLPSKYKDPKCASVTSSSCRPQPGGTKCTVNPYKMVRSKVTRKEVMEVDKDWIYPLDSCIEKGLLLMWRPPRPRGIPPSPENRKKGGNPEDIDSGHTDADNLMAVRAMVLSDSCIGTTLRRPREAYMADKQCKEATKALMELPIEDSDPKCELVTSGRCRDWPEGGKRCTVHPYTKAGFPCRDSKRVDWKTTYTLESCVEANLLKWWREPKVPTPPGSPSSPKAKASDVLMARGITRDYLITGWVAGSNSDSDSSVEVSPRKGRQREIN